ncbi:MAG: tryptophan--tRNA ligase [Candidatus Njordarchaeales archaeon]
MRNESTKLEKVTADAERMFREFQIQKIEGLIPYLPPDRIIEMRILLAHRDLDLVLREYLQGSNFAVVSGRGPSGPLHFGHIYLFNVVRYLQKAFDIDVYIPLSDDEKFVFQKIKSLKDGEFWAIDNAKKILALGFDPKKTKVYISTKQNWVYRYSLEIARKMTLSTVKAALGIDDSANTGIVYYPAVQIAHILQPTIDKDLRVVVPIGLDQDVYMRLARDVAVRLNLKKPASVYVRYIPGITGSPMSASAPETAVYISDNDEEIVRKVNQAFTGGQPTVEEQRKFGGNPDKCIIFKWLSAFVFKSRQEASRFAELCRNGELICGFDCKPMLAHYLIKISREIRRNAEKIDLEKYMMEDDHVKRNS